MNALNIQDIIDAMDMIDDHTEAFYSRQLDDIVLLQYGSYATLDAKGVRINEESDTLTPLPDRYEINDYRNMELFIETVKDETAAEWLRNAIHGRGAFRMFRAACERFHILNDWYDFREKRHAETAVAWCLENGFEYDLSTVDFNDEDELLWEEEIQEEEPVKQVIPAASEIPAGRCVRITPSNMSGIIYMYADASDLYHHRRRTQDIETAQNTLEEHIRGSHAVFSYAERGRHLGFIELNIINGKAYIEMIYVKDENRRAGIGRSLMEKAEEFALEETDGKPSVRMVPGFHEMNAFLRACGYDVLSAYEVSKNSNSGTQQEISLGSDKFFIEND